MKSEKIQKIISNLGNYSRRQAEKLIRQKEVKCNGVTVKIGERAFFTDRIEVKKTAILKNEQNKKKYVVLNKPKGVVTTMADEKGRKTIRDIAKIKYKERLYPVGRLDLNSQGLLILTNDGEFANFVMHPKNRIKKTYKVSIEKKITPYDVEKLQTLNLQQYNHNSQKKVKILCTTKEYSVFLITLNEGKKRQIRNMVRIVFGIEVKKLERIRIGPVKLSKLKPGQMRDLTQKELESFYCLMKKSKPKNRQVEN